MAAQACELDQPPATSPAHMPECGTDELDGANKFCVDLVADLFIREFLRRADEPVASISHHHIYPSQRRPSRIDNPPDCSISEMSSSASQIRSGCFVTWD